MERVFVCTNSTCDNHTRPVRIKGWPKYPGLEGTYYVFPIVVCECGLEAKELEQEIDG